MAKYSYEFKKQLVSEYLDNQGSYASISQKHGMSSSSQLKTWVAAYQKFGDTGLKRSRSRKEYSFEEKLSVVESYLTSELSYQELALQMGINNPSMLARWVNDFKIAGPDALRPHRKGRKKTLSTSQAKETEAQVQHTEVDTRAEHVKELEDELLKLRIENAVLKELRRLRLEDEAKRRG
ncbi:helix-turn-helix domain-containing protein, partial [Megasphaera butyrica]|uniref:helix-turn-helix domain-containing protein n=1 Tax=Megasphaera butyrica TaxID=2981791 RepID=UPI0012B770A1